MPRTRVKICGITDLNGLRSAADHGADAVGFVFAELRRRIDPLDAASLVVDLPAWVSPIGVFRRATASDLAMANEGSGIWWMQLDHECAGEVAAHNLQCLPVFRLGSSVAPVLQAFHTFEGVRLVEGATSGAGQTVDWTLAAQLARQRPTVLAGGLTPDNVAEAIRTVRPYGVDVSSGVESSPGKKDPIKIRDFLQAVRDVDRELQ